MVTSFVDRLKIAISLDIRSLAVMRMAYGLLILLDLAIRSVSFREHYGSDGAFPLHVAFEMGMDLHQISLYSINGTTFFQALLFLIHAVLAVLLLVGWRTRLMTVLCFVFAVSLQNRNFLILNGGDNWMRLVLFWAIFLPWGQRWSVDSLKEQEPPTPTISNIATLGFICQMMSVYFVSALYKTGPAWRTEGSAIYLALQQLEWNSDWGLYLLHFPRALVFLSFAIMVFELVGPWLFLSPILFGPMRTFATLSFIGFHLGLELGMELGVFPLVGICSLLGLFPPWAWDWKLGEWMGQKLDALFRRTPWPSRLRAHSQTSPAKLNRGVEVFLFWVLVFSLCWNLAGRQRRNIEIPAPFEVAGKLLALNQYWGLFAPEPGRVGGWIVLEGQLSDGSVFDLRTGNELDWTAPRSSSIYRTQRRKRWYVILPNPLYANVRPSYARFLFQEWDRNNPDSENKLIRVRGHWLSRPTLPNFEDPGRPTFGTFMDLTREQVGL